MISTIKKPENCFIRVTLKQFLRVLPPSMRGKTYEVNNLGYYYDIRNNKVLGHKFYVPGTPMIELYLFPSYLRYNCRYMTERYNKFKRFLSIFGHRLMENPFKERELTIKEVIEKYLMIYMVSATVLDIDLVTGTKYTGIQLSITIKYKGKRPEEILIKYPTL